MSHFDLSLEHLPIGPIDVLSIAAHNIYFNPKIGINILGHPSGRESIGSSFHVSGCIIKDEYVVILGILFLADVNCMSHLDLHVIISVVALII